ncbi:MAG: zf-TFIIB domain-containing protein [Myxococcota bacterium]
MRKASGFVKRLFRSSDTERVKLVACPDCHAQYDVSSMVPDSAFDCRCGTSLVATPPVGVDAKTQRCSSCGAVARDDADACDYCGSAIVPMDHRGGLICPECMARNLDDARFCLACGVAFSPSDVVHDMPERRCPCCDTWMAVREVGGLLVQECTKCLGLWAPEDVFDALVDRATTAARERGAEGAPPAPRVDGGNPASSDVEYRRCPVCDALMTRRNFRRRSGVIIDRCHEHGTWLDAHELERIAGFVLSGRAEEAERIEATQRATERRAAARAAASRARTIRVEDDHWTNSIFTTHRRERSAAESILGLLISLLD